MILSGKRLPDDKERPTAPTTLFAVPATRRFREFFI